MDGQWDVTPFLEDRPLSAVAFQRAIACEAEKIRLDTSSEVEPSEYLEWIAPYLFYFDVPLDNRVTAANPLWSLDSLNRLMLVPLGAPAPKVFQRHWSLAGMVYTNSRSAFYPTP